MRDLLDEPVFSVAAKDYRWVDVILAADLWGDWERFRQQVREETTCLQHAGDDDDDSLEDAIERAAEEFRYERDLVSADDMQAWLDRWRLSPETWMDFIRGAALRDEVAGRLADLMESDPASDDEVEDRMLSSAVCSGLLDRAARKLAGRAAVHDGTEAVADPSDSDRDACEARSSLFTTRTLPLADLELDQVRAMLVHLAELERSFARFCEASVTARTLDAQIRSAQIDWTRLECQSVSFSDEYVAREAVLCVTADGQPLEEVASEAHTASREESVYVEAVEPELRDRFLGARKGELIGPVARGDQFVVYLILDKVSPSLNDERVVDRAKVAIVERLVEQAINDRVKWHHRF